MYLIETSIFKIHINSNNSQYNLVYFMEDWYTELE